MPLRCGVPVAEKIRSDVTDMEVAGNVESVKGEPQFVKEAF